jgi:phosphoribosylformylglycinamidine cyclo-ligase
VLGAEVSDRIVPLRHDQGQDDIEERKEKVTMDEGATYRDAGVDIEAADRSVELMKANVRSTHDERVLSGLAEFGGLFALGKNWRDPVLVSGTDSVGSKIKIAIAMGKHDTVGQDVVAMCVDDIVCHGARPLFFLDYIGTWKLIPEQVAQIVGGVAKACKLAGCALIGGETAELPGLYAEGDYDLAGFAVGGVERDEIITGAEIKAGDAVIGLASSGLHSNGYALARRVLLEKGGLKLDERRAEFGRTLGEEMLEPTTIYAGAIVAAMDARVKIAGLAHITGGGIEGNLCRIVPQGLVAMVQRCCIPGGHIFELIRRLGNVRDDEMLRTFNCGVGMVAVVAPDEAGHFRQVMEAHAQKAFVLGEIREGEGPAVQIC